ncbi:MAG TPA: exodeoxyribonuclease VII small subunit [Candidatus Dormibacteraeota bacterium]|nr:exodeoxyribonuclease VII small subunit [Candidatus Dormibacteraeota bacterium]
MAEPGVDQLLDDLEKVIARLAEAREPIEELVVAYEHGIRILAEAEARLAKLSETAALPG